MANCKKLTFVKANPSGNTTVFVLDPVPRAEYPVISAALMHDYALCAEQVGFLEAPENPQAVARMHMMGGEFCGNASRSFAAWLAMGGKSFLKGGSAQVQPLTEVQQQVTVEVSGNDGLLTAQIENIDSPYGCFAEIAMPLPQFVRHGEHESLGRYSIVGFEGIVHVVLWQREANESLFEVVKDFLQTESLDDSCFGIMFIGNENPDHITPLVYVGAVGSLVWESSCGSGSLAVASALADLRKETVHRLKIAQPGGDLFVSVVWNGGFEQTFLAGNVYFPAVGSAWVTY